LKKATRALSNQTPEVELAEAQFATIWPSIKEIGRMTLKEAISGALAGAAKAKFLAIINLVTR